MASDDEFRRVAEEIRALARSLARDFRDAVDESRAGGSRAREAVRDGLKDVADEARRSVHGTFAGFQPRPRSRRSHHRGPWSSGPWSSGPWSSGPGRGQWYPPVPPNGDGGDGGDGPPWRGGPRSVPGGRYGPPPYRPRQRGGHRPSNRKSRGLPPVRHRWDATTVIGILAVVFGVAWLLDAIHATHISVEGAVAVGLMLLGAAMIVTGRTDWSLSRRSWPVFAGAALILVLVATSSTFGAGSGASGLSFGNKVVSSVQPGETVQGGFGNLKVNASNLAPGQNVTIKNIAGDVNVTLPRDVPVHVDAKVLAGQICIDGHDAGNGVDASAHRTIPGTPGVAPVKISVNEASGRIVVGPGGCSR